MDKTSIVKKGFPVFELDKTTTKQEWIEAWVTSTRKRCHQINSNNLLVPIDGNQSHNKLSNRKNNRFSQSVTKSNTFILNKLEEISDTSSNLKIVYNKQQNSDSKLEIYDETFVTEILAGNGPLTLCRKDGSTALTLGVPIVDNAPSVCRKEATTSIVFRKRSGNPSADNNTSMESPIDVMLKNIIPPKTDKQKNCNCTKSFRHGHKEINFKSRNNSQRLRNNVVNNTSKLSPNISDIGEQCPIPNIKNIEIELPQNPHPHHLTNESESLISIVSKAANTDFQITMNNPIDPCINAQNTPLNKTL